MIKQGNNFYCFIVLRYFVLAQSIDFIVIRIITQCVVLAQRIEQ
jgi:hypothetical protein